jgi:hypothetical protein
MREHGNLEGEMEIRKNTKKAKDEQPGMVTVPSSGGPAYKGRNLDENPVGDGYGSGDCSGSVVSAAGDAVWPGRVA